MCSCQCMITVQCAIAPPYSSMTIISTRSQGLKDLLADVPLTTSSCRWNCARAWNINIAAWRWMPRWVTSNSGDEKMPQTLHPGNFSKPELDSRWSPTCTGKCCLLRGREISRPTWEPDPCRGPSLGLPTFPFACPCRNADFQSASQITPSQHVGGLDVLFVPVDWSASKCFIPPSALRAAPVIGRLILPSWFLRIWGLVSEVCLILWISISDQL